jgi:hypothetical protein
MFHSKVADIWRKVSESHCSCGQALFRQAERRGTAVQATAKIWVRMYVAHAAGELPPRDAVRARERVYSSDESEESLASPVRSPRSGSPFSSVSTLSPTRSGIPVRVQRLGIGKEQFALLPRRWSDRRPAPRNKVEQRLRSPGTDLKTSAWAQIIKRRSGPCGSRGAAGSAGRTRPDHMVSPRDVGTPAGETCEPKYPFAMGGLPFPVKWEAVCPLDTYCRFPLELKIGGNTLVEVQSAKKVLGFLPWHLCLACITLVAPFS